MEQTNTCILLLFLLGMLLVSYIKNRMLITKLSLIKKGQLNTLETFNFKLYYDEKDTK